MELNGFIKREGTWVEKAKELWAIQERRLQLEKLESILKQDLISVSGEENSHGGGFILEKYNRPGNIEYKSIPELKAVNLELYRKPEVICWKLKNLTLAA